MKNEIVEVRLRATTLLAVTKLLEGTLISDERFSTQEIVALHGLLQELHLYTNAKDS